MDKINYVKPPFWFWLVAGIGLLWNLMGAYQFSIDPFVNEASLQNFTEAQQAAYAARPLWVTLAFGLSVLTGVLGCILLFLKKAWAGPVFLLSLLLVLAQSVYIFFLSNTLEVFGSFEGIINGIILAFGIGLMFFARHASGKRWIR